MFDFMKKSKAVPLVGFSEFMEAVAKTIGDRFKAQDREIEELRAEIEKLKREPRVPFKQKLRDKGIL